MRLRDNAEEREFAQWQLDVGHGRHTDDNGIISLPPYFHCPQNTVESLIDTIYPGIKSHPLPHDDYFFERSILSARNDDVDDINLKILKDFPGEERAYHSADSIQEQKDGDVTMYPMEYLNSINVSGMPLSKLKLKVGCPVMVLRNLNPMEGVCNGTRGIITRMTDRVLEVRLLGKNNDGRHVFIPRIKIISNAETGFYFCRHQFPVRLAFSMTINKAQGQSLVCIGLDARSSVFTHGQFYVAISRATSKHGIKAIWDAKYDTAITKNIVYPEVLLD